MLRLIEDGRLDLDDRASEHLPPELSFFDANGATIRQVLGDAQWHPGPERGGRLLPGRASIHPRQRVQKAARIDGTARVRAGILASTNYVLLGTIIEHAAGRPLAEVLRSDVLDHPGLEGLVYTVENALAADGWGVESTAASLARWGYELYGGFVLSDASLREMTEFNGAWYGLGVMDLSSSYGTLAVGHEGESSVTTCCSLIRLVALPEGGRRGYVRASQHGWLNGARPLRRGGGFLTQALRAAARE